jgi:hypothetical protein
MFYLAGPVATALGKILLQTTPDAVLRNLEACLREVFIIKIYEHVCLFDYTIKNLIIGLILQIRFNLIQQFYRSRRHIFGQIHMVN